MTKRKQKEKSFLAGAAILSASAILAKIIGAVFKIPLGNLLDDETYALFTAAYLVYSLLLTVSYSGIPIALSRLVSASAEKGERLRVQRLFSVALPLFSVIGLVVSALMFIFAPQLAVLSNTPDAALSIRVLSPAVFFCCIVSVYEGYSQGFNDMTPTAVKQVIEVIIKLVVGLAAAWWLLNNAFGKPAVAGGAISGAVVGLAVSLPVLIIYKGRRGSSYLSASNAVKINYADEHTRYSRAEIIKTIIKVSIPITIGACCMSIITLVDMSVVKNSLLDYCDQTTADSLYGVYSKAQTLFTMLPALLAPVTVAAIPAISGAVAVKDISRAKSVTDSAFKVVTMIAAPAAIGITVLGGPVYSALFGSSPNAEGGLIVTVFGPAAFFACLQQLTTAILQANGHERVPMITFPIGGVAQILLDRYLVSNPEINIYGSPYGTLACYFVISLLNFVFIIKYVKAKPGLKQILLPIAPALVMGAAVWGVNGIIERRISEASRMMTVINLGISVFAGVIVYAVLSILTGVITRREIEMLPKGRRIADILRLKQSESRSK